MENVLQQSQVRLGAHRHIGWHLASFQSSYHSGYHQSSGYATLDESSCHRTHDLGYQDHDLWRQERWRKEVALTKSCDKQVSERKFGLPLKFLKIKDLSGSKNPKLVLWEKNIMMKKRQEMYANFLVQGGGQKLSPREEKIITMVADGKDFEEIGIHFSVTRERIRQIADKASRKIKRMADEQEFTRVRDERLSEAKTEGIDGLTVEDLELSVKAYNCLCNAGITHVIQLAGVSELELLRVKNFGQKSLNEIKEVLATVGIKLKGCSAPILTGTKQSDAETIVEGIKKLPKDEAREVSLCLLNLMLPFTVKNQEATDLLRYLRDQLLDG